MKPVDQRYHGAEAVPMGDCVRACVASIFELELDEVSHFVQTWYQGGPDLWTALNGWAWDFGIGVNTVGYRPRRSPKHWHPGYWIASVPSRVTPGGNHAVVMLVDEVAHDPNPQSRAALGPYRFKGETWFELARPEVWRPQLDWRVLCEMNSLT